MTEKLHKAENGGSLELGDLELGDIEAQLRQKLIIAEATVKKLKMALAAIAGKELSGNQYGPYSGMRIRDAMVRYIRTKPGQAEDREVMERELLEGGAAWGKLNRPAQVSKSIDNSIRFKVLKKLPGGKIGLGRFRELPNGKIEIVSEGTD
jgi:hypothetical protein